MSGARILVVDDNLELAENVGEILEDAGFEADVHWDPVAALASVSPGRYALALFDVRMPVIDGIELCRRIKLVDPALPALAMTAYSDAGRIQAALEAGVLAVLQKPLDVGHLLASLAGVLTGERALVVEDDPDLASNLAELLAARGISPRIAHSCAEARALVALQPVTLFLVDCRLPDGEGLSLLEELVRGTEGCTAIAFSGFAPEGQGAHERAAAAGAVFLEKPLDLRRLLALLGPRSGMRQ